MLKNPLMRLALLALVCLTTVSEGWAQLQVEMQLQRRAFIRFEPILADVRITNLSGRPLELQDADGVPWFGFQISKTSGVPINPRERQYTLPPVHIEPGQTIARTVNLTPIFPLEEFGSYRVEATVYSGVQRQYYNSRPFVFELTEGTLLWRKVAGQPEDGSTREITLLSHFHRNSVSLYLRIKDPAIGRIYCTHRLGPLLDFGRPQVELDERNQIHVLHLRAPKTHVYSHVELNGKVLNRQTYIEAQTKPRLVRQSDGSVIVAGGAVFDPEEMKRLQENEPTISDRPAPLPAPGTNPTPSTATPEKRPGGINLWPFRRSSPSESESPQP
jgi:hypothetical protein